MFSRGNITEKIRFGKLVMEGDVVLDMVRIDRGSSVRMCIYLNIRFFLTKTQNFPTLTVCRNWILHPPCIDQGQGCPRCRLRMEYRCRGSPPTQRQR